MIRSLPAALCIWCLTAATAHAAHEVTLVPAAKSEERKVALTPTQPPSKKEKKRAKQQPTLEIATQATTIPQEITVAEKKPYYNRNRVKHGSRKKWVPNKAKTLSDMNFEELKEAKNRASQANNKEIVLKYAQKMLPLCNDLVEHANLMLETADMLLETGSIKEASSMYQDFSTMYPGHERISYASFKAIDCSYATVLIPERDQTATLKTIELAQAFLSNSAFKTYHEQVETILQACYKVRFDSEVSIITFFIKQNNIAPAQKRASRLRETQLLEFPQAEKELIELECLLASKKNDTELLLQKQAELATKFPEPAPLNLAAGKRRVDHMAKF